MCTLRVMYQGWEMSQVLKNKANGHSIPVLGKLFLLLEPHRHVRSRPGQTAFMGILPSWEERASCLPLLCSRGTEALPLARSDQRCKGADVLLRGGVSYYQFNLDSKYKPCISCHVLSRSEACWVARLSLWQMAQTCHAARTSVGSSSATKSQGSNSSPSPCHLQRLPPWKVSLQMCGVYMQRPHAQKVFSIQRNTLRMINKQWLSLETAAVKWPKVTIAPLILHVAFSLPLPAIFHCLWNSVYPWAIFSCYSPLSPVNICKICCSGYLQEFIGIADYQPSVKLWVLGFGVKGKAAFPPVIQMQTAALSRSPRVGTSWNDLCHRHLAWQNDTVQGGSFQPRVHGPNSLALPSLKTSSVGLLALEVSPKQKRSKMRRR